MTPAQSVNLRRLGLAIEAVCVLGLLSIARQGAAGEPQRFFGMEPYYVLGFGIAVGFALWLGGTITYYISKRNSNL